MTQVAGIHRDREVGTAAQLVRVIDRFIFRRNDIARLHDEKSAGRKADDADLIRIDLQLLRTSADELYRSLRVLQRSQHLWLAAALAVRVITVVAPWHPIS